MKKFLLLLISITLLLFITSEVIFAGETGKIAGKVIDKETGEPLIGANIIIVSKIVEGKEVPLAYTYGAATDIDGEYYIINIPPGYYNVKASYVGYNEQLQTNVEVNVDKTTRVDFQLSLSSVAYEEVYIVGYKKDQVESDLTATKQTYTIEKIETLPGVTDVGDIVSLQADVSDGHFRGGRSGESLYLVGGSSIVNPLNNSRSFEPIAFAFQQVEVYTSGFSAEYGNVQSGVVNLVTKEGPTDRWETKFEVATTNSYYKTWGGSVYSRENNPFFEKMYNPEEWLDGKDPSSGKILWTHFGINFPENYLPPVPVTWPPSPPLSRMDSLRTASLVRALWLQAFKLVGLEYDKPDYRVDFSLGGPVANNTSLFVAGRYEVINPILPTSQPDLNIQMLSSLMYRPSSSDKFKLILNYSNRRANEFHRDYFGYFDPIFNLTINTQNTLQMGAEWNHVFCNSTFMDVKIGWLMTDDIDDLHVLKDNEYSTIYNDNSNWRFYTDPSGHTVGSLYTSSGKSKTNTLSINASVTSQVNKNNLLKTGVQFFYYDMNVDRRSSATNSSSVRFDKYHAYPYEGALYIQDKLEFEGMIANVGLRYDFYNFNTFSYLDKFSPYRNPNFDPTDPTSKYYSEELAAKENTKLVSVLQPRIGISFPIDVSTVLHLNYGLFTQRPAYQYVFLKTLKISPEPNFTRLGNPDLKPEKTISYDIGIVRMLPFGFSIDLSAYLKDVSNLVQDAVYVDRSGNLYQTFNNREYADIKGFHINIEKNEGAVTGFIRYNWQSVRGKNSSAIGPVYSAVYYETNPENNTLPAPEDIYLDFDRTHRVLASLKYSIEKGVSIFGVNPFNNVSLSMIYRFQTGRPFTYDETGQGLRNNRRTPDEHDLRLRIDKKFTVGKVDLGIYLEAFNVLNSKVYDYNNVFSESPDNRYKSIYVKDRENLETDMLYAPYVTKIESFLYGNTPRHFRLGVNISF